MGLNFQGRIFVVNGNFTEKFDYFLLHWTVHSDIYRVATVTVCYDANGLLKSIILTLYCPSINFTVMYLFVNLCMLKYIYAN